MDLKIFILIIVVYLIGSIPFAYILTSLFGFGDIRKIGSGNVGATNVLRTGKKNLALSVLTLDIFKGFIPVFLLFLYCESEYLNFTLIFIGCFSILGHIFPIWLKFKGGKGVATYIGFLLGIDYQLCLIFILFWISIALIKKYSSLASILTLIIIPFSAIILSFEAKLIYILGFLSILIIFKHIDNIKRLLKGDESKIKF